MAESHKYVIGYTQTNNEFGHTNIIPTTVDAERGRHIYKRKAAVKLII